MDKQVIHFTSVPIPNVEIVENAMPLNVLALQGMFKNQEIQSIHPHAKAALKSFFIQFNKIKTAGGLVYHPQSDSYLWIKRLGLWDLPKGKIEQGESSKDAAIREIIEECGLTGKLSLKYRICSTYHVYEFKNKSILKKNNWYYLEYEGDLSTKPQEEESITEVQWVKKEAFDSFLSQTYPSIQEVILHAFES
ncbi:MAG: NUDIX domain-containing protein [Crocinitomicaceae bacterium]|nr:NUDIX domain-containing protein [Crocinitomicaceae bacterium]MBP6032257.1 NUDIX domain-containing protein [Crocinitomicaceae bacterium]